MKNNKFLLLVLYRMVISVIPLICAGFSVHGFMGTCVLLVLFQIELSYAAVKESRKKKSISN